MMEISHFFYINVKPFIVGSNKFNFGKVTCCDGILQCGRNKGKGEGYPIV